MHSDKHYHIPGPYNNNMQSYAYNNSNMCRIIFATMLYWKNNAAFYSVIVVISRGYENNEHGRLDRGEPTTEGPPCQALLFPSWRARIHFQDSYFIFIPPPFLRGQIMDLCHFRRHPHRNWQNLPWPVKEPGFEPETAAFKSCMRPRWRLCFLLKS
jgi:hypothetical protein